LLNIDWRRARAKLNGHWGKVGLDDHHLWGDDVLRDGHIDHFLGTGGDDGGGHWANLHWWAGSVVWLNVGLGALGGDGTRWVGGSWGSGLWDGASNCGTVSMGGRHQTIALDGAFSV